MQLLLHVILCSYASLCQTAATPPTENCTRLLHLTGTMALTKVAAAAEHFVDADEALQKRVQ